MANSNILFMHFLLALLNSMYTWEICHPSFCASCLPFCERCAPALAPSSTRDSWLPQSPAKFLWDPADITASCHIRMGPVPPSLGPLAEPPALWGLSCLPGHVMGLAVSSFPRPESRGCLIWPQAAIIWLKWRWWRCVYILLLSKTVWSRSTY